MEPAKFVSAEDAKNLASKLTQFRDSLGGGEQEALDALLKTFGSTLTAARKNEAFVTLDKDLAVAQALDEGDITMAVTPTLTTVTITTTVASHPVITCKS
ncbi:MAG: hypothetical protein Q7U37_04020 [Gallionella sp.]|nr:hypothetical protein [Gallionella sp.]